VTDAAPDDDAVTVDGGERTLVYMDLGDLVSRFHPSNPKLHSLEEIRRSMSRFGYTESILLDERTGLLAAGHGRVSVLFADAKAGAEPPEGITVVHGNWHVPVQRGWASKDDEEAMAYLVASNRLVEIGGWDDAGLASMLQSISQTDLGLAGVGYDDSQLADLLAHLNGPSLADDQSGELTSSWSVIVSCKDEFQQIDLIRRMAEEGYECRALLG